MMSPFFRFFRQGSPSIFSSNWESENETIKQNIRFEKDKCDACCEIKNTCWKTDLAVFVNEVLEVVFFGDDGFGDERLVVYADGGQHGGAACVSQPRDLCRLLVVLVLQVQTSLHGHDLTISPSERGEGMRIITLMRHHVILINNNNNNNNVD